VVKKQMSLAKNYIYNTVLQITNILFPFITLPYISRILGPQGVGTVAFTGSVVQYFILFGVLGLTLYANRAIAYARENTEERNQLFWEIFVFKLITSGIALLLFYVFLAVAKPENLNVYLVQSLLIISAAADISWFFMGLEEFKKTVLRSLLMKSLGVLLIFLFVRSGNDVVLYALIGSGTTLLGQLVLWTYIPRYVQRTKVNLGGIFSHFHKTIKLFIPVVAVEVYVVLDKTMVGLITNEAEVGIYEMSQRLVKMALSLVTSMGIVMVPRMSAVIAKRDNEAVSYYAKRSFQFASYGSFLVASMLIAVIPGFAPVFFGEAFLKTVDVIRVISPIVILIAWSNVLGMQMMVPMGMEKKLTISVTLGAIINFSLNLFLIPLLGATGAAIASVVAEFCVTASQIVMMRKIVNLKSLFSDVWKHFLSAVCAFLAVMSVSFLQIRYIYLLVIEILLGVIVYLMVERILRTDINLLILSRIKIVVRRANKE
jgi:O-antigen/teichoic acid export membrane protein